MNRKKAVLTGTLTGTGIGLFSASLSLAVWAFLASSIPALNGWNPAVARAILLFSLTNGAIIGGLNGVLYSEGNGREQVILSILMSLAVGAAKALLGGYAIHSLMPIAIYGLAFLNGWLVTVTAVPVIKRTTGIQSNNVLIG